MKLSVQRLDLRLQLLALLICLQLLLLALFLAGSSKMLEIGKCLLNLALLRLDMLLFLIELGRLDGQLVFNSLKLICLLLVI